MPQGFFTIEQWSDSQCNYKTPWVPILHFDSVEPLDKVKAALARHGKRGLYRVIQTQCCFWAEAEDGKIQLRESHAESAESLACLVDIYERAGGNHPPQKPPPDADATKPGRSKKR